MQGKPHVENKTLIRMGDMRSSTPVRVDLRTVFHKIFMINMSQKVWGQKVGQWKQQKGKYDY